MEIKSALKKKNGKIFVQVEMTQSEYDKILSPQKDDGYFEQMRAEVVNDEELRYGDKIRIYWEVNDSDNMNGIEAETELYLNPECFPIGTKIFIYIPNEAVT